MRERLAVLDSGPLVALGGIDRLDILRDLFDEIAMPEAVHREVLVMGASKLGAAEIRRADWIRCVTLASAPDPLLARELGAGESEAITLAVQASASRLIVDDRQARRIAKIAYDLPVRGTVGVLVTAYRRGAISELGPLLDRIRENGYFLSDRLVQAARAEVGE